MSARKDHQRVIRAARKAGATISTTGRGHLRLTLPSGNVITTACSPGDVNAHRALLRDLRRAGLDLTGVAR